MYALSKDYLQFLPITIQPLPAARILLPQEQRRLSYAAQKPTTGKPPAGDHPAAFHIPCPHSPAV